MKWPVIAPAWQYGDPSEFVDQLIGQHLRHALRGETISLREAPRVVRDRYYTQSRRLHIQKLMRGRG